MLPNIFWSRTDYISGAYATKMVAISSPEIGCHFLPIEFPFCEQIKRVTKINWNL